MSIVLAELEELKGIYTQTREYYICVRVEFMLHIYRIPMLHDFCLQNGFGHLFGRYGEGEGRLDDRSTEIRVAQLQLRS